MGVLDGSGVSGGLPGVLDDGAQGDVLVGVGEFDDGGVDFVPSVFAQGGFAEVGAEGDENRIFGGGGIGGGNFEAEEPGLLLIG